MENPRINIEKAKGDIKTIWHIGYLLNDKKGQEIILEVESMHKLPLELKLELYILGEGILNSDETKPRTKIDFESIEVNNYEEVVHELSKITGLKFKVEIIKN
jgi:hypothetical protein